ncbi:MAG: 3-oxoacyl-ACP synthase [Gammaproteobacteria bacterium]|jgi:3-oxoacyl-[acyl-carrier-protein] synthase-3|nr:3-oxoacyl-ACP synthase [Gammaproteobacteria bacterium]
MTHYARIVGTGGYLPEKVLDNAQLEKMVDTSDQWILERTGIAQRHIMADHETTSSMSEIAARRSLDAAGLTPEDVELIVIGTSTPDRFFPSTATILQQRLGIKNACPAFDVSATCSGFIYALSVAEKFIKSGSIKTALVIGAESLTRLVDWTDRSTCILFSDGAAGVVLTADNTPGIISTHIHSDGSHHELMYAPNHIGELDEPPYIKMKGNEVFKLAVNTLSDVVDQTLAHNDLQKSDIDWLIPHQANLRIIKATAKKLGLPMERVILTVRDQGNTSAASIPLALDIAIRDGRIQQGDMLLFETFGAGLTWGSAMVRY